MIRAIIGSFILGWVTNNIIRMIDTKDSSMISHPYVFTFAVVFIYALVGYLLIYLGLKSHGKMINDYKIKERN